MREIRTEIEIAASPLKVWDILTDLDKWKEWNPIVNQASGNPTLGSKISITMSGKDGKDANNYTPLIIKFEESKSFHWRAEMMASFLFTNERIIELEETDLGTRLIQIETFSGLLVSLFWGKMEKHVPAMLKSMNEALKELAEKQG